jgi:hypothetical protein
VEKLLQEWARAIAEAQCAEAMAYCASPGARARAAHKARICERRAAKIARILQTQYGVDPVDALRRGLIR